MNSPIPNFSLIKKVVNDFYQTATKDILIGFHFERIEDLDSHIERISYFWQLQLTGKLGAPEHLPFKLIEVHRPLKINRGQIDRWIVLFHKTLSSYNEELGQEVIERWKQKIDIFKERLKIISQL